MTPGKSYRHHSAKDMDLQLHEIIEEHPDYIEIAATLYDRKFDYIYEMGKRYVIKRAEIKNWRQVD